MEQSTGLIVVGMHRSGTSALTGALHAFGANAGDGRDLTGSSLENQKGFFERRDIRQLCDALLYAADADWWKISDFEIGHVGQNQLEQQRRSFSDIVETLSQSKTWIIKEPRLCLLLPLLIDLIPNPICVFIYRNPIEVAKSLRTRNQISLQQGISLWEKYNSRAIEAIKGRSCIFVSYQDLIAEPSTTLDIVVNQLADLGVQGLNGTTTSSDFIDRSLQRSVVEPDEMEILTKEQRLLWNFLETGAEHHGGFEYEPSRGQRLVLQDLEYQFERCNKLRNGNEPSNFGSGIRSRKVFRIARILDRMAIYLASKTRK